MVKIQTGKGQSDNRPMVHRLGAVSSSIPKTNQRWFDSHSKRTRRVDETAVVVVLLLFLVWRRKKKRYAAGMLYIGRVVCGLSAGLFSVAVPTYTAEIAVPSIRGTLGNLFQMQVPSSFSFLWMFWLQLFFLLEPKTSKLMGPFSAQSPLLAAYSYFLLHFGNPW